MMFRKNQQGIGLIEVLVSLVILSIALLGYVALQYRAIEATTEGTNRIQAINLARDLSEKIRVNREALATYKTEINKKTTTFSTNCFTTMCTANQKALFDAAQTSLAARRVGMQMNMITCPQVANNRNCIYVSWAETAPTEADGEADCTTNGVYRSNSTCIILEAY